ncbi:V8-like Glu-specific endopeptidase [Nonomuraea roseoviolacea subsp. carminata]|uniref:V8-like Glu-specific endopeptidase n=1 Tax=Nonomuraea roseoviolacea subsp. carminata TaxID=160689 RepID=A0ABT1JSU7_9ACTN|nr:V8-like Glu-specific endopeptidase [Nonomuraea roseoviolacea subsp. carminata]
MLRSVLSLTLPLALLHSPLVPDTQVTAQRALAQRSVPQRQVLTPGGDRLGYAPVAPPYAGERRLAGLVLARDPVAGRTVLCGGAVIRSRSRSLVLTAAHCLYDQGRKLREVSFLPGFQGGRPPLGVWRAARTWVPQRWRTGQGTVDQLPYDVGLIGVGGRGPALEDVTGRGLRTLPTRHGTSLRGLELLGYPAGRRYPGTDLYHCLGDAAEGADRGPGVLVTRNCHAPDGGSGGPALHDGAVAGVVSSSSPLHDPRGFTVLTRLGGRTFRRMLDESDRWMSERWTSGRRTGDRPLLPWPVVDQLVPCSPACLTMSSQMAWVMSASSAVSRRPSRTASRKSRHACSMPRCRATGTQSGRRTSVSPAV